MTPPKEIKVNGQTCTLFREGPPHIYLRSDGRFTAEYAGDWIARTTLASLDKKLKAGRPSLKIFHFHEPSRYSYPVPEVVDATEFLRSKIINGEGKRVHRGHGIWHVYDEEKAKALVDLARRWGESDAAFHKEHEKITKGLKRVHEDNFAKLLKSESGEGES